MTLQYLAGGRIRGLSSDTKPLDVQTYSEFVEVDTALLYLFDGASWIPLGSALTSFSDSVFEIYDNGDATKILKFDVSAIAHTTTRTISMIDEDLTIVGLTNVQVMEGKTINLSDNSIIDDSDAQGDLIKSNGTKFVRFGIGTALQVLRTNAGANDLEWATIGGLTPQFSDADFQVYNDSDPTKTLDVSLVGADAGFNTQLAFIQTANRVITFPNATGTLLLNSLTSAHIFVGNGSNIAVDVAMSGDITIDNTGATAIGSGVIVNADINAAAAIAKSKISSSGAWTAAELPATVVYNDQANSYGDFLQTFKDNKLKINSPSDGDGTILVNSEQTADRNLTIPILTGDDTIATIGLAQTFAQYQTFTLGTRSTLTAITYASSITLDFDAAENQSISLTGNLTLDTSNRAASKKKKVFLLADGSTRTLTFPTAGNLWRWLTAVPANIAANKTGVLTLECVGTNSSDVVAAWSVTS